MIEIAEQGELMVGQIGGIPVRGCSGMTDLRVARQTVENTLAALAAAADKLEDLAYCYDIGQVCEDSLDDLAAGYLEELDGQWFLRRSRRVLDACLDADEDGCFHAPEHGAEPECRKFASALNAHGRALVELGEAEKRAILASLEGGCR